MKVLLVSQYFFPEIGATQTRMYEFARALTEAECSVDVLTEFPNHPVGVIPREYQGRWFEDDRTHPFRIVRVRVATSKRKTLRTRAAFYGSFCAMALAAAPRLARSYDAVVATSPPLPAALAGMVLSRLKHADFIMDVRDLWPKAAMALGELRDGALYRLAERIEMMLYRRAARITATTRAFCADIASRGIAARKISYVPNGTLEDVFDPGRGDAGLRSRLGLDGKFVVTFAGLHGIAQGLPAVLEAATHLRAEPDVVFMFVGEGPRKADLIATASARGLHNVRFLPQVPLEESAHYLNASDALLVTLGRDPVLDMFVPSKLYDAMACAKPVILAARGEARETVERAGAGLVVEPEDANGLACAIRQLVRDASAGKQMGERGRQFVVSHFSRRPVARRFAELVKGLRPGAGAA